MPSRAIERQLADVARLQHGIFTLDQVEALGVSPDMVYRCVNSGTWLQLAPGMWRLRSSPRTWLQTLMAATSSRFDAVVSGLPAASLNRFDGYERNYQPEITVPYSVSGRSQLAKVRRSIHFHVIRRIVVDGIPTADGPETIFRLANHAPTFRIGRMLDQVMDADASAAEVLGEIYLRHQGERMRGIRKLRPLLLERIDESEPRSDSELEALLDLALAEAQVPEFSRQVPFDWGTVRGRVDRVIPAWRLIVEADGRRWHARTDAFERDRERDNQATARGYGVLRFTWRMLVDERDRCSRLLEAAGSRRQEP
ncbi:MAG: DUF559 domain-containing protein [Acidimicrobiia bacterium]|nr:DUF559 domain-containing protein [Acidimicrobiia bacterium]